MIQLLKRAMLALALFCGVNAPLKANENDKLVFGRHVNVGDTKQFFELKRNGELFGQTFRKDEPVSEKRVIKTLDVNTVDSYFERAKKHLDVQMNERGTVTRSLEIHVDGRTNLLSWKFPSFHAHVADMMDLYREVVKDL